MDLVEHRRLKTDFLVAILEVLVIFGASALVALVTGRSELLQATLSVSQSLVLTLAVLWYFAGRGMLRWFWPEMMPAIQMAVIASRVFSGMLPERMSDSAAFSLELLCPLLVGGAMAFILSRRVVRQAATSIVETWV